jgi:hypothetical protein
MNRFGMQAFYLCFLIIAAVGYNFAGGNEQAITLFTGAVILLALGDFNK